MAAAFEDLPIEVVELIVDDLPLADIKNLRLASRDLRCKASDGLFRTYFTTKTIDLRVSDVGHATESITPGSLPCLLEHLIIAGVLYVSEGQEKITRLKTMPIDPTDPMCLRRDNTGRLHGRRPATQIELIQAQRELHTLNSLREEQARDQQHLDDVKSLISFFKGLREHCIYPKLKTLSLKVIVYRDTTHRLEPKDGGAWRPIWKAAAHTYAVTLQALGSSMLQVENFDVFGQIRTCSLPGFDLAEVIESYSPNVLDDLLGTIESLSLSTCNRVLPQTLFIERSDCDPDDPAREEGWRDLRNANDMQIALDAQSMASHPRNTSGVAEFLQKAYNLQELDLHKYHLQSGFREVQVDETAILRNIAELAPLKKLVKLTLRGFPTRGDEFLRLLRNSPRLESVDLRAISLKTGTWRPIFNYLSAKSNNLMQLRFYDLFEPGAYGSAYVCFAGVPSYSGQSGLGTNDVRYTIITIPGIDRDDDNLNVFTRETREDVLRGIEYVANEGWLVGCIEQHMWRQERVREYGPPDYFGNFV